ncbi:MAG: PAS domain S-box protein [Anaerolineae bacterium]|nr:PAS domain S-box protein [Anaerolineae bacterium]
MARGLLASGTVLLVLALLGLGYLAQGNSVMVAPVGDPNWGHNPLTVAVGLQAVPLFYQAEGKPAGLLDDLFRQAPLGERSWLPTAVSERDAVAAVNAGAADLALLAITRGSPASGLGTSGPLLSHPASLLAPAPPLPPQALQGQRVAWSGPEGLTHALLRLGAEPVGTTSVADCLTRALDGGVVACAVDELVGAASVRQLGLGSQLAIVGDPIATIDYVLAWRPGDRAAPGIVSRWIGQVTANGLLESLRRRWLGMSPAGVERAGPSDTVVGLVVALAATGGTSLILGASNLALRRRVREERGPGSQAQGIHAALIEQSEDAMFVLDAGQLGILDANPRAYALTGYGPGELVGMRFQQLVPSRHRRLLRQAFLEDEAGGALPDVPLVHRDGTVATVSIRSRMVETDAGPVRLCVVRDVTEQRLMQREIRRLSEFAERVLDSIPDAVVTVNAAGYVTSANRAFIASLGLQEAPEGRHIDRVVPCHGFRLSQLVNAVAEGESREPEPVTVGREDGRDLAYSVTAAPMEEDGQVSGVVLVLSQPAEQSGSSAEYQRLAMLSTLGQVSGVLAHDIRNRVTGVHVGVQYLAEKFPQDDPRRRSMEFIRAETERVMEVVDDILMLIRPGKVERHSCRVSDILDRVIRAHAPLSQASKVQVTASMPASLPQINGDPVQLERALGNLVKNGIEAAPEGGRVRISVQAALSQSNGQPTSQVRISISDNGPGIPPNIRAKLFQPFVSEKLEGTGLGLSVAKRIIDEHGGCIEVDTSPNQGTTFTVVLPAVTERG